jgi:hypothetical protein
MSYCPSLQHCQTSVDSWDVIFSVITALPNCSRLVGCHTVCHYNIAKLLETRSMSYSLSLQYCQIVAKSWDIILWSLQHCQILADLWDLILSLQHCQIAAELWDVILSIITTVPNFSRLVRSHTTITTLPTCDTPVGCHTVLTTYCQHKHFCRP